MQYMLLVWEPKDWSSRSREERDRIEQACWKWHDRLVERGQDRGANALVVSTGRMLRHDGTEAVVTDGPYAETKEVLGGYQMIEAESYDAVVALVKTFPALPHGFGMEVREVMGGEVARVQHRA